MRYRVTHQTRYRYANPVMLCHNEARLVPQDCERQQCRRHLLVVAPEPKVVWRRRDYFGNHVTYFAIEQPHRELTVTMTSEVDTHPAPLPTEDLPWERVRDQLEAAETPDLRLQRQFLLASDLVPLLPELDAWAALSFPPGAGLIEAATDLMRRIHAEFHYDPEATSIATPLQQVWQLRRGVCQDFAHLAICALRGLGLSAGYVSGYLETLPPPGQPKLVGSDASHAWFAVWMPDFGWVEFDPTNNKIPNDQYVVLARGRDYADVAPLRGVIYGGGHHSMEVSVDVYPLGSLSAVG